MKNVLCLIFCSGLLLSTGIAGAQSQGIPGSTVAIVNLRSGPGTRFAVVEVVPQDTPVTFVGRNESRTWLLASVGGQQGWLFYSYANVEGRIGDLPVVNTTMPARPSSDAVEAVPESPPPDDPGGFSPRIGSATRRIYLRGQQMGNRADVFAKVGDSITASDLFLDPVGNGGLRLHGYESLRPAVEFFSQTPARTHNSFANTSLAAGGGWTTADVLDPARSRAGICQPGESPLICEYRVLRPAVALIMLGTNDVVILDAATYRANLNRIVEISIDMGVIPVLSTIPDRPGAPVSDFNRVIRATASAHGIPLWDYWRALQGLPNRGLSSDNIHPSHDPSTSETAIFTPDALRYGYNMRNLTALMMLDAIWRQVMQ